jgi:hypothetical protein
VLSLFGGNATIVPASDYFQRFGRWASERDVVSLPVGLRFNVSGDERRSTLSLPCPPDNVSTFRDDDGGDETASGGDCGLTPNHAGKRAHPKGRGAK